MRATSSREGRRDTGISVDEAPVDVAEADETAKVHVGGGCRPVADGSNLLRVDCHACRGDPMALED